MLARGVLKSQVGKVLEIGLSFVAAVLLTRVLGPAQYGSYVLILSWLTVAGLLIALGLSESISRFLPVATAAGQDPFSLLWPLLLLRLGLAAVVGLAFYLSAPLLFPLLGQKALIDVALPALLIFVLLQATTLLWSYFTAQMDIDITIVANLLRSGTLILAVAAWALIGSPTLRGALLIVGGGYGLALVVYGGRAARRRAPQRAPFPRQQLGGVLRFGLSAWGVTFVTFLLSDQTDIVLLGLLVPDTRAVAIYQVGTSLVWKLIGVITVGSQVVLAALATLLEQQGEAGLRRGWQIFVKLSAGTILPVYVFVGWHAPLIIRLVFGPDYAASAPILRLFLALMALPVGLLGGGVHLMTLYALGRERLGLALRALAGVANLLLALLLIAPYGPAGAVLATGMTTLLGTLLEYGVLRRRLPLPYPIGFAARIAGAVFAGALALALLPGDSLVWLLISGLLYAAVLLGLLRWWRPLAASDVDLLARINPRLARLGASFAQPALGLPLEVESR